MYYKLCLKTYWISNLLSQCGTLVSCLIISPMELNGGKKIIFREMNRHGILLYQKNTGKKSSMSSRMPLIYFNYRLKTMILLNRLYMDFIPLLTMSLITGGRLLFICDVTGSHLLNTFIKIFPGNE